MADQNEIYYRYEDSAYDGSVRIYLREFRVVRHTPKGVWIDAWGRNRFILVGARKSFAHPTPEEAKKSFLARKQRQISILTYQLKQANAAYSAVTKDRDQFPLNPSFLEKDQ